MAASLKDVVLDGLIRRDRISPAGAIHLIDNLAVLDYDKCAKCERCVDACRVGTIASFAEGRRAAPQRAARPRRV